jgi:hypothetical protein
MQLNQSALVCWDEILSFLADISFVSKFQLVFLAECVQKYRFSQFSFFMCFLQLFSAIFLSLVSLIPELYFRSCGLYRSLRMASLLENYLCVPTPPACACTHCAKGSMHAQVLIQMSVKYGAADACHGNWTSKIPTHVIW